MHCTADTEHGDYVDDPDEAQLRDLIAGLGQVQLSCMASISAILASACDLHGTHGRRPSGGNALLLRQRMIT